MNTEKKLSKLEEYHQGARPFMPNDDHDEIIAPYDKWTAFKEWYQASGKECFKLAFKEASKKSIPKNKSNEWLITTGLPTSNDDYEKKSNDINFYRVNAFWFLEEVDDIIKKYSLPPEYSKLQMAYAQIMNFISHLILYSDYMLNICARKFSESPKYRIDINPEVHVHDLYSTARFIIYGSFAHNNNPDVSISIIRQALEIRIRRAFGINYKIDQSGNKIPISLSEIIAAMEPYKDDIEMKIDFFSLKKINSWANAYLHSGVKRFIWMPSRILNHISGFILGGDHAPGFHITINSGIVMRRDTFISIKEKIKENIGDKYQLEDEDMNKCDIVLE
jgi:hypothetical protein